MKRILPILLAVFVITVEARVAGAVDVPVRGWSHENYGRLVFDWPVPVTYTAAITGRQLAVRFDNSITPRYGAALRNLAPYIAGAEVSSDGRVAQFALKADFQLRSFKNENSVVIDILRNAAQQTRQAPILNVRVGEHPTYTRLVFDWRNSVTYEANLSNRRLNLRFDRAARIDLDKLRPDLPPGVVEPLVSTAQNATNFSLNVPADTRLRHFRSGTKVVVDLLAKSSKEATPVRPKPAAVTNASPVPPVPEPKESVKEQQPSTLGQLTATDKVDRPRRLLPKRETAPSDPESDSKAADASDQTAESKAPLKPEGDGGSESKPASAIVAKAFQDAKKEEVSKSAGGAVVSLVFEWPEPVGAAVFERAGFVWIIFDKRVPLDLAPLRAAGKGLVTRLEQLPIGKATVLRMVPRNKISPFARRDGTNWVVDFVRGRIRPEIQIPIEARTTGDEGAELFFPAIEVGEIFRIPDPEVGDLMHVATVQASSQGISGQRAYPEFQILASTQGIAIVPLSDELNLAKSDEGLSLSMVGGLHISGISPDSGRTSGTATPGRERRIFKMAQWPLGGQDKYYEIRQRLLQDVAAKPAANRNNARLKLAQFYFSRGLGPEAKGVLDVLEQNDERLITQHDYKALKGAIAVLNGDMEAGARNLNDPRLDKYEEIRLWRGLVAASQQRWKEASLYFKQGDTVLHGYPEPMKSRLALKRINAALLARDTGSAGRWLNVVSKKPDSLTRGELGTMKYLQGRVAFVKRDLDRATELWEDLVNGRDLWNAVRAELSLVNLGLLQETITTEEATERLERLRYKWRGDDFELQVLRRLGGLYLERNAYREGLGTYRVIATYFLDHPDTKRIAEIMTDTFKSLYLDGEADKLSPLTALALFDEFRELTPVGPDGNEMIQKLAERLVDVDLLNRAAELLQHQVKYRLKGEDRAVVGARLALIHLLDQNPKGAIDALRSTAYPRLPEELDDDRRRIQARAYFETGRTEDAIELLAGDVSRNADLLRADINWRTENWPEAANSLQRMAGEPPEEGTTFDRAESQIVLNWAVALRLSKDESGLAVLRELYGPAMAASPLGNAFQFIASPSNSDEPVDLETITSRIAETDVFDAFLKEYLEDNRKRLLRTQKAPPAPAPPPPAATPQAAAPETAEPSSSG